MVLMMSRPFKHPKTGVYYFRKAVPDDLRAAVGKREEKRTLGTKDPTEAKQRHAEVASAVEREWLALRSSPITLTNRQVSAIAGLAYAEVMTPTLQDEPGSPAMWAHEVGRHERLRDDANLRAAGKVEQWLGESLDGYARSLGIRIADADRPRVLDAVNLACLQAAQALKRNAEGDYRPDPDAGRFPAWVPETPSVTPASPAKGQGGLTLTGLAEAWWQEAKAVGTAEGTGVKYTRALTRLREFIGHDAAGRVTPADVVRFKDHRLSTPDPVTEKPISPLTVRGDLAALKAVFGWAVGNLHVPMNPAEKVTVRVGKPLKLRSKAFTDAESVALLVAANALTGRRTHPKTFAAKRWVPWLCAYTGARVGEMAQLRRQDLRQEGDLWVVTITPEAGTVKTNEAREVVVHPHLVEMGFPAFVAAAAPGHLFITPAKDGNVLRPLLNLTDVLGKAAREVVADEGVAPNHGWRHRFKTLCRSAGIEQRTMDVIQGHAARTASDGYGDVTLEVQAAALARFPRQGN